MELKVSRVDLRKTKANWPTDLPFAPAHIERQPTMHPENWFVLDAPLMPGETPSWAIAKNDPYVRVPLFPYRLSEKADLALAYMVQLGLCCAAALPGPVKKFWVVTGVPVDLLYEDGINTSIGIEYWFGLALTTEQGTL